jgi:hypothetical protein
MHLTDRACLLFHRFVLRRVWTSFLVLGLSFLGFATGTVSLAVMLKLNLDLVFDNGWQALMDGAALQLLELLFSGYMSMAFYVVFKTCEHRLVHGLGHTER